MLAMVVESPGKPLVPKELPVPQPGKGEILVRVLACGVCRTDLHVADGELSIGHPVVPGHEIVGEVVALGEGVDRFREHDRAGIPWLASACGRVWFPS